MKANLSTNQNSELSQEKLDLIKTWFEAGKKQVEIASLFGVSTQRINYHILKIKKGKFLREKALFGRKTKVFSDIEKFIVEKVEKDRFISSNKLVIEVKNQFNLDLSSKTIRNVIQDKGFEARSPRKVPLITDKNKENRIEAAKSFLLKPLSVWKQVHGFSLLMHGFSLLMHVPSINIIIFLKKSVL
jgi:transposase